MCMVCGGEGSKERAQFIQPAFMELSAREAHTHVGNRGDVSLYVNIEALLALFLMGKKRILHYPAD